MEQEASNITKWEEIKQFQIIFNNELANKPNIELDSCIINQFDPHS